MGSFSSPTDMADSGHLFSRTSQAIFYNWKTDPVQSMLDFDYICRRDLPSIAALVTPGSSKGNQNSSLERKKCLSLSMETPNPLHKPSLKRMCSSTLLPSEVLMRALWRPCNWTRSVLLSSLPK